MLNLGRLLDPNEREVKRHLAVAAAVNALEPELKELDDAALRARSDELRQQAKDGHDLDELLIEAFALCREASRRTIGLRHFDVQLVGGIVLHQGKIAEMKTGEGKTLVASLALYLNALPSEGVHLVTVNDYLARRDAGWMGPIYHALGMSVGVNVSSTGTYLYDPEFVDETHPDPRLQHLRPVSKHEAYMADITYATNSELAFDYLRDNMARDMSQCSQRVLNYAIVDEVDSILVDEARTPHIISGQSEESTEKYYEYARWAARLNEGEDFEVELKHKSASLTEAGIGKMERWTGIRNIYDLENIVEAHQINQALKAKTLFLRDRDYLVKDGEVVIVELNKEKRPVLVGTVSVKKSERLARMLEKRGIKHNVLNAKQHEREAAIVAEAGQPAAVTIATNMAGRGTDIVLGDGVTGVGGLHIIGTERHESRRIANQLRGRAGRQGDPGSSRFFISLEDDLMKIFGPAADRIGRLMDSLEVEPIEHPWVARSIASAQKKVEGMHFDARKHVVEYDDVMNKQRQIVYEERQKVLEGADARGNILGYVKDIVEKGIDQTCESRHVENWDLEGLVKYLSAYLPIAPGSQIPDEVLANGRERLAEHLNAAAAEAYDKKVEEVGADLMPLVEKDVMLRPIDWPGMEYLPQMEHFREASALRAYGQRDPLVEYKNEAFEMFNELRDRIQGSIVSGIFRVQVQRNQAPPPPKPVVGQIVESGPGELDGSGGRSNGEPRKRAAAPVGAAAGSASAPNAKIGRNDPCWCGSGKKYKRCHGR